MVLVVMVVAIGIAAFSRRWRRLALILVGVCALYLGSLFMLILMGGQVSRIAQ